MPDDLYTAKEAADKLGLKYTTFLARARTGQYSSTRYGWSVMFNKKEIDDKAAANADASKTMGETTR